MTKTVDKSKMACNKPRTTPDHPKKSHIVKACEDGKEKIIRFGQQGVKGSPDGTKRNEAFKARHAKNIAKGKMSAAFWADKVKWTIIPIGITMLLNFGESYAQLQFKDTSCLPTVQSIKIGSR